MNKFISIFFIFYLFSFSTLSETKEKGICEHFFNTLDNESENKILYWEYGDMYFQNTCKQHTQFNAGFKNMTMVVLNVLLEKEVVDYILSSQVMY